MTLKNLIRQALLKEENLVDLLSTAFYGNEWFTCEIPDKWKYLVKSSSDCREDKWSDVLKGGGNITITDWEDDESKHDISLEDIVKGLEKLYNEHLNVYARVMSFDGDADFYDADAVMQYAVYGEWVYG